MWQIEFSTDKFLPYLPEDSQGNPGVYGFELALWLSQGLMKRNIATAYPLGEDWGWFIEYLRDELELMICCSSQAEDGEGYKGTPIQWSIFIRAPGGLFKKTKGPQHDKAIALLADNICAMLQQEGITFERAGAQ